MSQSNRKECNACRPLLKSQRISPRFRGHGIGGQQSEHSGREQRRQEHLMEQHVMEETQCTSWADAVHIPLYAGGLPLLTAIRHAHAKTATTDRRLHHVPFAAVLVLLCLQQFGINQAIFSPDLPTY